MTAPETSPAGRAEPGLSGAMAPTKEAPGSPPWTARDAWRPAFPSPELVDVAAALLPGLNGPVEREGPCWELTVAPGLFAVGTRDHARRERTAERHRDDQRKLADAEAAAHAEDACPDCEHTRRDHRDGRHDPATVGCWRCDCTRAPEDLPRPKGAVPSRAITEWSRQSRANMVRTLSELDYTPMVSDPLAFPAMVTLTYPGDWLTVAPSGRAVKRHMDALRKQWRRMWLGDAHNPVLIWKLEFQGRGAPHVHMLTTIPAGRTPDGDTFGVWLSRTWADIVAHPDPEQRRRHRLAGTGIDLAEGLRARDPRRVTAYFLKHSSPGRWGPKEYQHQVPDEWSTPGDGPGRFWGYWELSKRRARVRVAPEQATRAARLVRRYSRAQGRFRIVRRPRVRGGRVASASNYDLAGVAGLDRLREAPTRYRATRVRVELMTHGGRGWVAVTDGPAFASTVAGHLDQLTADDVAVPVGLPATSEERRARLTQLRELRAARVTLALAGR